jgi:prepilin-type N-terminal cleavage/methylation domain-containing protein
MCHSRLPSAVHTRRRQDRRAFTLTELLVVLAITALMPLAHPPVVVTRIPK